MPTITKTSPGGYYHEHIRPTYRDGTRDQLLHGYPVLEPVKLDAIPTTAKKIAESSWFAATSYDNGVLTIWLTAPNKAGQYHGMRFADVPSYHLDGLHGSDVAVKSGRASTTTTTREYTDDEMTDELTRSLVR